MPIIILAEAVGSEVMVRWLVLTEPLGRDVLVISAKLSELIPDRTDLSAVDESYVCP